MADRSGRQSAEDAQTARRASRTAARPRSVAHRARAARGAARSHLSGETVTEPTTEPTARWIPRAGGAVEIPAGAPPRITLIDYTPDQVIEREITDPQQCENFRKAQSITWVNVDGLQNPKVLEKLSLSMGFHSLTL